MASVPNARVAWHGCSRVRNPVTALPLKKSRNYRAVPTVAEFPPPQYAASVTLKVSFPAVKN